MFVGELPIAKKGMLFKCKLCGQKCCNLYPEISEGELEKIRKVFPSFKPYFSSEGKMLLLSEKGYCPFLNKGLCTIHEYKPIVCQIYPFYPVEKRVLDDILELTEEVEIIKYGSEEYVFFFDEKCPGVGEGEPINFMELLKKFLEAKHFLKNPL
ncbi:MAG: YkgJ family cysteine cluster protein [Crenarchaeota archaeon]|nr:YkgJ family cysteine cluster protein [Thermoproteota archaeon]MDW8034065.1 YkgJ family cysteine cluster protein [Nitrososphaerota archaeon]